MFSLFRRQPLLDAASQATIVECIKRAESKTSGEIRVFMEERCEYMDAMDRATEIFFSLGMEQTVARNAIIIYLATKDRQFALFGDKVIYELAGGPKFWENAAKELASHLRLDQFTSGLCACIEELGNALALHFPPDPTINKNELPDEIVFGKR